MGLYKLDTMYRALSSTSPRIICILVIHIINTLFFRARIRAVICRVSASRRGAVGVLRPCKGGGGRRLRLELAEAP